MSGRLLILTVSGAVVFAIAGGGRLAAPVLAQGALAQLGLTEASARTFLLDELKSPTTRANRRTSIAIAGHRAFFKLPPAARGPAATALFAWARTYVNSPAFKTAYAEHRRNANPLDTRLVSADDQFAATVAEMKAGIEMARKIAEALPPAERDALLAKVKEQEAQMPAMLERMRSMVALEQNERIASNRESAQQFEEEFPENPNELVARRLRLFLDETADADFNARIIRLTGGPDGMEFVEPVHRAKSSTWQLAVLAGPEATRAARAAAEAWLKAVAP